MIPTLQGLNLCQRVTLPGYRDWGGFSSAKLRNQAKASLAFLLSQKGTGTAQDGSTPDSLASINVCPVAILAADTILSHTG